MSISTYSELQARIATYAIRSDLTALIPDFIALCEADLNSEFNIRTLENEATVTTVYGSRYAALPTGFREEMNLWLQWPQTSGRECLRFVTPETIQISTVNGIPTAWCIDGTNVAFNCPVSSTSDYSLVFRWMGGLALSDSATTNLVLTNYPNVYLFGSLKQAALYMRDPDALALWGAEYDRSLEKAKAKENRVKALVTLSTEPGALSHAARRGYNIYRGW